MNPQLKRLHFTYRCRKLYRGYCKGRKTSFRSFHAIPGTRDVGAGTGGRDRGQRQGQRFSAFWIRRASAMEVRNTLRHLRQNCDDQFLDCRRKFHYAMCLVALFLFGMFSLSTDIRCFLHQIYLPAPGQMEIKSVYILIKPGCECTCQISKLEPKLDLQLIQSEDSGKEPNSMGTMLGHQNHSCSWLFIDPF